MNLSPTVIALTFTVIGLVALVCGLIGFIAHHIKHHDTIDALLYAAKGVGAVLIIGLTVVLTLAVMV